jgi:asparagine synthetase B (glutamine-hydrolysing)
LISDENLAQLRALIETILDEKLAKYEIRKKPPEDISEKRRAAAMAMLAKRAERAIAEQMLPPKKLNGHAHSRANAEQMLAPERVSKRKQSFVLPEWLEANRDVWDAWVEARTRSKHPPTSWAKNLAVAKLERMRDDGHNVRRLLADAAFNNWQSFYVKE